MTPTPVLNASRVHHCSQQQPPQPLIFLPAPYPRCPFWVVLTDWKSMMTTLGLVRMPALARTCWLNSA